MSKKWLLLAIILLAILLRLWGIGVGLPAALMMAISPSNVMHSKFIVQVCTADAGWYWLILLINTIPTRSQHRPFTAVRVGFHMSTVMGTQKA